MRSTFKLVLALLALGWALLAGCRASKPSPLETVTVDSITVAAPGQPAKRVATPPTKVGKKSTVNYYLAPATVASAGKKGTVTVGDNNKVATGTNKGNQAQADSAAQVVDQAKAKQAAANTGAGSRSDQLNTAPPDPPWYSFLLGPIGKALAIVLVFYLLLLWAKRRSLPNA